MSTAPVAAQLDTENPWPGLAAFEENATGFFHGRDTECAALLRSVLDSPITVLYGRSGLGKTSLLRAALFPALRQNNFLPISVRLDLTPEAPPLVEQLRRCVRDAVQAEVADARPPDDDETIWEYLHRTDVELWSARNFLLTPVIVIDQFEEVFTLGRKVPEKVKRFRDDLGDLVENRIPAELAERLAHADAPDGLALQSRNYKLLISLREDFLPDLEEWRPLIPLLVRRRMRLLPMNKDAAFEAVHRPAPQLMTDDQAWSIVWFLAGKDVSGSQQRDTPDAGPAGDEVEPALLSLFCRELNEARRQSGAPRFDDELIEGARRDVLDDYYASCVGGLPDSVARFVEDELITQKGFRNIVARDDAVPDSLTEDELAQLIGSRLVRLEDRYGAPRIELTHDVLTGVVRKRRDGRELTEEKRQRTQLERSRHRARLLSAFLVVALVAAMVLAYGMYRSSQKAAEQQSIAFSRLLSGEAAQVVDRQPQLATLLGLQSLSGTPGDVPFPLVTALARNPHRSRQLTGHAAGVVGVAFSPDGALLATASADHDVRLWDVATGSPHGGPLTGHTDTVWKAAFNPDGSLLATASADGTARLWDVATGRPHGEPLTGHGEAVDGVAFSPDGALLATASADKTVRLWDVATGRPHGAPLTGHTNIVTGVAFSPDGTLLATTSADRTARLWNVATGQPHGAPLAGHDGTVYGVAFSPDGALLATTGADRTARLWDVATGQPHGAPLTGHADSVFAVAFSPDGTLLATGSADSDTRLWDVATGRPDGPPLVGDTNSVFDVRFSPDGRLLATASTDQSARLWDVAETWSISTPLTGHAGPVLGTAFSPDGRLVATAGTDQTVRLWDAATKRPHGAPFAGGAGGFFGVTFSPDGALLATAGADGTARLWDVATGQPHGPPLTGHTGWVLGVAFSPDGRLVAAAGADKTVLVWDVATGQPHGPPLKGHRADVYGVAFSPDGRLLASAGGDRTVRLWDVATGLPHGAPITGHTDTIFGLAFSPDGSLVATASADRTVRLWDMATGKLRGTPLSGHDGTVYAVAFSRDGTLLATGSADRTVLVWDVATGKRHDPPLTGHTDTVNSVAFSPDGTLLASAGGDGAPRLWQLGFSRWVEAGCDLVRRNLSLAEWQRFAGDQPYERTCPGLPSADGAPPDAEAARYGSTE